MSAHVDWNWPILREKYIKIDWSVKIKLHWPIREFKKLPRQRQRQRRLKKEFIFYLRISGYS